MEALLVAADTKDPTQILTALEKVKDAKEENLKNASASVNLGNKRIEPMNGLSHDIKPLSEVKKQKVEEEEEYDPFTCENCGS
jgi:hypothetical protein